MSYSNNILTIRSDTSSLSYKNDEYQVYNIIPRDVFCDLHLIVSDETNEKKASNEKKKILIPVDRTIMMKNLPFFEHMFREESNWAESNRANERTGTDGTHIEAIQTSIRVKEKPRILAEYLRFIYTGHLKVSTDTCVEFLKLADFFQNSKHIEEFEKIVETKLRFMDIVIKLMKFSDKFDERIRNEFQQRSVKPFYSQTSSYLSEFDKVCLEKLEIGVFIRFINLLRNSFEPKLFIELIIRRLKLLDGEMRNELIEKVVMDINFDRVPVAYRFKVSFCRAL